MQNMNNYYMTPQSEVPLPQYEDDVELFHSLSSFTPTPYYPQDQGHLPLIAPLVPSDLSEAVSRMQMEDYNNPQQRGSIASTLSLEIKPCISITEPTPVNRNPTSINFVDQFIHQHSTELNQASPPLQQQQQQQQQQQSFSDIMDPNTFLDDLLMANSNMDWLSWTPARGSPVSIASQSFDDQNSIYSNSSEPPNLYYNLMMSAEELLESTSMGYPSPSLSAHNGTSPSLSAYNGASPSLSAYNTGDTLTVKKNRSRRVSEPPKLSSTFQEQFLLPQPDQSVKRSRSDGSNKRRGRSNSSASASGNHFCSHPGCGKSFTRPYNLTSHMRTHTADRPFACSQCGRKFARQHDRNRHEKLHWGIKPYACNHCQKPFARMDALNRHLRVENGCQQLHQQQQMHQQQQLQQQQMI